MIECEDFFKALSDETRQGILKLLEEKPMRVTDIALAFDVSQPTISHHLDILKRAGLVGTERKGQNIYYSMKKDWFQACCADFLSMFSCCSDFIQPSIAIPGKRTHKGKK